MCIFLFFHCLINIAPENGFCQSQKMKCLKTGPLFAILQLKIQPVNQPTNWKDGTMKILFTLKNISGQELAICFAKSIKKSGVGVDEINVENHATLSASGFTWITTPSRFEYEITNPGSEEHAIVMYTGTYGEFLTQKLLPEELKGETSHAEVFDGNALLRHGLE